MFCPLRQTARGEDVEDRFLDVNPSSKASHEELELESEESRLIPEDQGMVGFAMIRSLRA